MSHVDLVPIQIADAVQIEPIKPACTFMRLMWACVFVGAVTFCCGLLNENPEVFWGAYYVNLCFWMGLSVGGVMLATIFQIVRAKWSAPIRRIAEASVAFLPWAYCLFLGTYYGKEYLFPWARAPMPGREWWMQPDFVYTRFAILFAVLFLMMTRYVRLSLRGDIGVLKEESKNKLRWTGWHYDNLVRNWKGSKTEIPTLQNKMSFSGPILVAAYAVIYSLFAFEMIMGMDTVWYSNMFGGWIFIGNMYLAWAGLNLLTNYLAATNSDYSKILRPQQAWDMGKLSLAFGMLWAYMFLAQFLPQWYGNLPEETQWMILRVREYPWKPLSYITFAMCFVIPFILYLSEDVKRVRPVFATTGLIIFLGIWCEKYVLIMPQLSPAHIPFSFNEVGLFLGFMGIWAISVMSFLKKYPFIPLSHPLTRLSTDW